MPAPALQDGRHDGRTMGSYRAGKAGLDQTAFTHISVLLAPGSFAIVAAIRRAGIRSFIISPSESAYTLGRSTLAHPVRCTSNH